MCIITCRIGFVFIPQLLDRFYSYGGNLRPKPYYNSTPYDAGDLLAGTVRALKNQN